MKQYLVRLCFFVGFFLLFSLAFSAEGEPIAGVSPSVKELYPGVTSSSYELSSSSPYGIQKITVIEFNPKQEDLYFDVTNTLSSLNGLRRELRGNPARRHAYTDRLLEPTSIEEGALLHICEFCGDTFRSDPVAPLGHTGGLSTCVSSAVCSRCKQTYGHPDPDAYILAGSSCAICGKVARLLTCGDLDGDGEISSRDAVMLSRLLAKWEMPEIPLSLTDTDGDGRLTSADAVLLSRTLSKWSVVSKIGEKKYSFGDFSAETAALKNRRMK